MGGCLHALHSTCADDVVKLTATDLVDAFLESMKKTRSPELKVKSVCPYFSIESYTFPILVVKLYYLTMMMIVFVMSMLVQAALCSAYVRIARSCDPHIWRPECLINLLCSSEPCFPLIECLQVAICRLGLDLVSEDTINNSSFDLLPSENYGSSQVRRVGEKRSIHAPEALKRKRQRIDEASVNCNSNLLNVNKYSYIISEDKKEYADTMHRSLLVFIELLYPPGGKASSLGQDVASVALSTLCIVFCEYPHTEVSRCIFRLMREWNFWICEQVCYYLYNCF